MDRSKVHNLDECLDTIKDMEKICADRYSPRVCKNLQAYYRNYCYKTFEHKPFSSVPLSPVPLSPVPLKPP